MENPDTPSQPTPDENTIEIKKLKDREVKLSVANLITLIGGIFSITMFLNHEYGEIQNRFREQESQLVTISDSQKMLGTELEEIKELSQKNHELILTILTK